MTFSVMSSWWVKYEIPLFVSFIAIPLNSIMFSLRYNFPFINSKLYVLKRFGIFQSSPRVCLLFGVFYHLHLS